MAVAEECEGERPELTPSLLTCSTNPATCLLGGCLPCVLHGMNAARVQSAEAKRQGEWKGHCLFFTCFYLLTCGIPILGQFVQSRPRAALRHKYNIAPTMCSGRCEGCDDFCVHTFCHTCALCQEANGLDELGEPPAELVPGLSADEALPFHSPTRRLVNSYLPPSFT